MCHPDVRPPCPPQAALHADLKAAGVALGVPSTARIQAVFSTCLFDAASRHMPGWQAALANVTKAAELTRAACRVTGMN